MKKDIEIGDWFSKGKGTITITNILQPRKEGKYYIYEIECVCSVCNIDTEMYPNKFIMKKKAYKSGYYPCGCAERPLYDENQYEILIRRIVSKYSKFEIRNISNFKGSKTDVKLFCNTHNELFGSNYNRLVGGIVGCKSCIREEKQEKHKLSKKEAEYRVVEKCILDGYVFVSMDEYTTATKTYFTAVCPNGTEYRASYNNFVNNDHGCPCCSKSSGGYNNKSSGWLYLVKWSNGTKEWLKIGITGNDPIDRFERQKLMGYKGVSPLTYEVIFTRHYENGRTPEIIEKKIKEIPRDTDVDISIMPDGYTECFSLSSLGNIKKIIENFEVIE